MELDRETVTEIVVSVGGVLLFIVALVVVGLHVQRRRLLVDRRAGARRARRRLHRHLHRHRLVALDPGVAAYGSASSAAGSAPSSRRR
ncbi:MAG: hypothetical protein U5J98_02290 [Halobacteriales archaeon]|nr:hypothetical protein [Halobacteriales archaeon]